MSAATAGAVRVPARDPLEHQLLDVWSEILRHEDLSATDNFFDAGGHSLLAVQLVSQIERRYGYRVPVAALFEAGTVAGLADRIRAGQPASTSPATSLSLRSSTCERPALSPSTAFALTSSANACTA